jgi:hypothetical protein
VQKHYNLEDQEEDARKAARDKRDLPRLKPSTESLRLESQDMRDVFRTFLNNSSQLEKDFTHFDPGLTFTGPLLVLTSLLIDIDWVHQ